MHNCYFEVLTTYFNLNYSFLGNIIVRGCFWWRHIVVTVYVCLIFFCFFCLFVCFFFALGSKYLDLGLFLVEAYCRHCLCLFVFCFVLFFVFALGSKYLDLGFLWCSLVYVYLFLPFGWAFSSLVAITPIWQVVNHQNDTWFSFFESLSILIFGFQLVLDRIFWLQLCSNHKLSQINSVGCIGNRLAVEEWRLTLDVF